MRNVTRDEYLEALETIKIYIDNATNDISEFNKVKNRRQLNIGTITKESNIFKSSMSVRTYNILRANFHFIKQESTFSDLDGKISFDDLLKSRNCGKSTVKEICAMFKLAGIDFKQ